jgi:hypothetical protein
MVVLTPGVNLSDQNEQGATLAVTPRNTVVWRGLIRLTLLHHGWVKAPAAGKYARVLSRRTQAPLSIDLPDQWASCCVRHECSNRLTRKLGQ